jgi:hypothetical protein
MYLNNDQINIKFRFKRLENIVVDEKNNVIQLQYFNLISKKTISLRVIKYNPIRKAYRINRQWVSHKQLTKLLIKA